jgi:hypothetical protein
MRDCMGWRKKCPPTSDGKRGHVLSAFLQQEQVGMMAFHQPGNIFDAGAHPAQQIPADHPQSAPWHDSGKGAMP